MVDTKDAISSPDQRNVVDNSAAESDVLPPTNPSLAAFGGKGNEKKAADLYYNRQSVNNAQASNSFFSANIQTREESKAVNAAMLHAKQTKPDQGDDLTKEVPTQKIIRET